jgi:4'-phosphopantetheinyl transferase
MTNFFWPARQPGAAGRDGVHIYAVNLEPPPLEQDWAVLSAEETARAQRFVRPADAAHFVRAHAALRHVVAAWADTAPEALQFSTGTHGKPGLAERHGQPDIRFNLSHSGSIALIAVSRQFELGVDVEVLRPVTPEIAREYFAAAERRHLDQYSGDAWLRGFFRVWTSKEALLKGEGLGLNIPLDAFEVAADPDYPPALVSIAPHAAIQPGWRLFDVQPARGTAGTLAIHDPRGALTEEQIHRSVLSF